MSNRYTAAHANPEGPGDARPTALQIIKDNNLEGALAGKVALITGVSSGIGLETAKALAATGMRVFGAVRNLEKAKAGFSSIDKIELLELDMNSLESVRSCAATFLAKNLPLNILITNAGIMMTPESRTVEGFESQFGINHLAHFLLFQLLKPTLIASATPEFGSRVISLSSISHRTGSINFSDISSEKGYDPVAAYAQSKLANIYMANAINRKYAQRGLHAMSVMPGGIWTNLQSNMPASLTEQWKEDKEFMKAWKSVEQGAATSVFGAVDRSLEGVGGVYLEDCGVAERAEREGDMGCSGYAGVAMDEEISERLWNVSCGFVEVSKED
jgi:NAD(P)-dependent dehydrogenase (short-subunit alcohol dehydrogenase family)